MRHLLVSLSKLLAVVLTAGILASCGTARVAVRVKSSADGTLTSNISISGNTEGGAVTPNVNVSADSSAVTIPIKNNY